MIRTRKLQKEEKEGERARQREARTDDILTCVAQARRDIKQLPPAVSSQR
jgi:hypothetical protein